MSGDFNLNILDHDKFRNVHSFLSLLYKNDMIPTKSKLTRVTRKMDTRIDHILINHFVDVNFKTEIFKTGVLDNFPLCVVIIISSKEKIVESKYTYVYKRVITDDATKRFTETVV